MVEQASLESKFNEQECSNTEKFVMTEPLKKCSVCKKLKPLTEFYKHKLCKRGIDSRCKECSAIYRHEHKVDITNRQNIYNKEHKEDRAKYYTEHREEAREYGFLHYTDKRHRTSGYYYGQGICLICGEIHPFKFENHHVVPWDKDFVVSLCGSCHTMLHSGSRDKHMIAVMNAIENSKFLWDSEGQPKGLKPIPMWTADLPLKEAIQILKSYDLPGYEPIGVEV